MQEEQNCEETKQIQQKSDWRDEFVEAIQRLQADQSALYKEALDYLQQEQTDLKTARVATKELYFKCMKSICESVNQKSATKLFLRVIMSELDEESQKAISTGLLSKDKPESEPVQPNSQQLMRLQTLVKSLKDEIIVLQRELMQRFENANKTRGESDFGAYEDEVLGSNRKRDSKAR